VNAAVVLDGVSVNYGRHQALRNITATLPTGAIGLLGPNGAGKSTLIKTLLGLIAPCSGRMRVLGYDVRESPLAIRARVGYMPESDVHIPGMTAVAFVAYCGELAGLPPASAMQRAHEVLFYVGLGEGRYRNLETYSTGMKQRIKLAQALVHDPDLLFLDEPTNGMDPKGRDEMLALVRDIATAKAITLIFSSHLLPDVEFACDHVLVLHRGVVAAEGPIATLKGTSARVFELRVKGANPSFIDALRGAGLDCDGEPVELMRVYMPENRPTQVLFQIASQHGVQIRHLRASVPSLEDVFARALGEPLESAADKQV
jgi:ABC-2 type transport system ATP-binding protein